ncbi:hypothetical protein OIU34_38565 [Pararhizobium sp. BT-229]|uniref:hypothetical protein n=1 Tax=Pararhizobium sp. BT-229 TaxID=2986923 RepID=UPI0021F6DA65|nr:hypothetical protein [Pararhizobium sp. BT-229]MCV9967727.1 hypothetical protein [Pararhizobium sp. BT-229]
MVEKNYRGPEHETSTGLPLGIMVLSVIVITTYLFVGGAFSTSGHAEVTVHLPSVVDQ